MVSADGGGDGWAIRGYSPGVVGPTLVGARVPTKVGTYRGEWGLVEANPGRRWRLRVPTGWHLPGEWGLVEADLGRRWPPRVPTKVGSRGEWGLVEADLGRRLPIVCQPRLAATRA